MQIEKKGLSVFIVGYLVLAIMLFYSGMRYMNDEYWGSFVMDENVYFVSTIFLCLILLGFSGFALVRGFMIQGAILGLYSITFFLSSYCQYQLGTSDGLQPLMFSCCIISLSVAVMSIRARAIFPCILGVCYVPIVLFFAMENTLYETMFLLLGGVAATIYGVFNWMHFQDMTSKTEREVIQGLVK